MKKIVVLVVCLLTLTLVGQTIVQMAYASTNSGSNRYPKFVSSGTGEFMEKNEDGNEEISELNNEDDDVEDEEEEERDKAEEKIGEAEEEIQEAEGTIEEAEEKGLNVTTVRELLNQANNTLSEAKTAFDDSNFEKAEKLAEEAKDLAESAKDLAKELLEKAEETEHSEEEEDEEEDEELETREDEEGNLNIISGDNSIEFKREEPKIEYEYITNETEIKFEAKDFALTEFLDQNNDSKIQEDEINQTLELGDLEWVVTYEEITEGNNTIITVTYYTNSTAYEIRIIMRVYQRSVTESYTTFNGTMVFDVDGGADEVKFDLIVSRWNWTSDLGKLALFMKLETDVEGEIVAESVSVDEDQIEIKVDDIEIKSGWVKKAKITWEDNSEEFVSVTVDYESAEIDLDEGEVGIELKTYFIYPHFDNGTLTHDPSVGVEDDAIIDLIPPIIQLEYPISDTLTAVSLVTFQVSASDIGSGISSVKIYIDNAYRGDMGLVGEYFQFETSLSDGSHSWYIEAIDGKGNLKTSEIRTITIDTISPELSIQQSPTAQILPSDIVTITADVADMTSGIEFIILMYSLDNGATWNSVDMIKIEEKYVASIPGQEEGTTVKYYVIATDFAGNQKVSDTTTYAITAPGLDSWMIYGIAFTAVIIAVAAYYIAHKRKHPSIPVST